MERSAQSASFYTWYTLQDAQVNIQVDAHRNTKENFTEYLPLAHQKEQFLISSFVKLQVIL